MTTLSQGLVDKLYEVTKRDDDAALLVAANGDVYVETSEDLSECDELYDADADAAPVLNVLDEHMLERAADARPLDAPTRVLSHLYFSTALVALQATLFGLPLFFWPLPHAARVVVVCLAANGFVGFYAAMLALRQHANWLVPLACAEAWALSLAGVLGGAAGLADNAAPLVLGGMLWAQHVTVLVYVRHAGAKRLDTLRAVALMITATLCMWCLNIVTFVSRHDWVPGSAMLGLAVLSVGYTAWQLRRSVRRYNTSWADAVRSVVEFYGDPVLAVTEKLQNRETDS